MIALALLLQAGSTVGDTMWVERLVRVPERRAVRASDWAPEGDVEVLGVSRVTLDGDSVRVAYPVVAWRPGVHVVDVPGPLLVGPDGSVDSLPTAPVTLTVRSVLPDVPPDSTLRPQPPAQIVSRRTESAIPLVVLWSLAAAILAPLHIWWRRRGRAPPTAAPGTPPPPPAERWAHAGEYRAALGVVAARLRSAIPAAARPDLPGGEVAGLVSAMDTARFAPVPPADARELLERARALETSLTPGTS